MTHFLSYTTPPPLDISNFFFRLLSFNYEKLKNLKHTLKKDRISLLYTHCLEFTIISISPYFVYLIFFAKVF